MQKVQKTLPYLIIFLASSVALSLYGYLGSFTRFIADDYCSYTYANEMGFFKSVLYWYRTWSGRYSAFGMDWLVLTKLFGRYSIQFVPPITLILWLIFATGTITLYLKSIAPGTNNLLPAIALASGAIYTILTLSPNVPQSFYWWNGMRSYMLPLVVLTSYTFLFQFIAKRIRTSKQLVFWGVLSFLLLFASGGLGETYVVLQFALLGFLLFLKIIPLPRKKTDPELILLLAGFLGTILSLVAVIASPGNAIRQSRLGLPLDPINLALTSIAGYAEFISIVFNQANKVAALLGIVALSLWMGFQYKDVVIKPWKIVAFFVAIFGLSFAAILPGVYGYSQLPPTRTMILPVFGIVLGSILTAFFAGNWLSNKTHVSAWSKNGLIVLACTLMIVSGFSTSRSLYESRGVYIAAAEKWDRVDAQILQAKAEGDEFVEIPDMTNWTGLDRPIHDPSFWLNECYTDLYGIEVRGPFFPWE